MAQVLAAQESVRLERARREEVTRLLDDARTKLTAAYEELRGVREEVAQLRAAEAGAVPAQANLDRRAVEERLAQARERELRLAEQHSTALAAIESLQGTAATEKARAEALEQRVVWLEGERARAERAAESDAARLRAMQQKALESPLSLEQVSEHTELEALRDVAERLQAKVAVAEAQEKQARALVDSLESDLAQARTTALETVPEGVAEELEALRRAVAEQAEVLGRLSLETQRADDAEAEADALRQRLADVEGVRQQLLQEASALRAALDRKAEDVGVQQAERTQALAEAESVKAELQAAQAAAEASAEAAARAASAEEALRAEVALLRASGAEARASAGTTVAALAEARQQLAADAAEREAWASEKAQLLQRLQASEQEEEAVREAKEALEAAAASAANLGPLREQLEQAQGQLRVARALRDTLQRELEAERTRGRELLESHSAAQARAAEVQAAAAHEAEELERARDAASTALFERNALEEQLSASSTREEALQQELETLRASSAGSALEAQAQRAQGESLERQLTDAEAQLSALVAERAELAAHADALVEEVGAERGARAAAEEAAQAAQRQAADVAQRADELQALARGADAQRAAFDGLRAQLASVQAAASAAQGKEAELQARLAEAQARLEMVQRRATAQETELSALRRASGRPSAEELKSIYERAQAEISAAREGARRAAPRQEDTPAPTEAPPPKKR